MDDVKENRLSAAIKVRGFLLTKAVELSTVAQIATEEGVLNGLIVKIIDTDGNANIDNTGFTAAKENARLALTTIALKVSNAATSYYLSIDDIAQMRTVQFTPTALRNMRDSELYRTTKKFYELVSPIEANLSGFNSGPAEVLQLQTRLGQYWNVIDDPGNKQAETKTANDLQEKNFSDMNACLERIDIYMSTFSLELVTEYKNNRNIDDTGPVGETKLEQTYNIPAGTTVNVNTDGFTMHASYTITGTNPTISAALEIGFGPNTTDITAPINSDAGSSFGQTAGQLGFNAGNTKLNIRNNTGTAAVLLLKIRS